MKHSKRAVNNGYSFVEMLIVLAIMAIMSAMAIVTWNSVKSAKYKQAVSTFESELSTLRTSTMGQGDGMAMKVYYDADYSDRFGKKIGAYVITRGYVDNSGTFQEVTYNSSSTDSLQRSLYFSYAGVSNPVFIMQKGKIQYAPTGSNVYTDIDDSGIVIQYYKSDGSVKSGQGDGVFRFYKDNGKMIADVHLVQVT